MTGKIASIQARLKNIYRQGGSSYQLILTRYFQERLLFRLSMLEARNNFLLKGGVLIYALDGVASRPTLDLDLLARKISPDPAVLREVFLSIGELDYPEDGVVFDTKEMELTEIIKEGNYRGIKIKIWASLGNIRQRLQIDVGFGDKVVPGPVTIHFPTLLAMQGPELLAYSKESLVAEKFEAMKPGGVQQPDEGFLRCLSDFAKRRIRQENTSTGNQNDIRASGHSNRFQSCDLLERIQRRSRKKEAMEKLSKQGTFR